MKRSLVSTGLAFVDLLSGALIGLVILHLISPTQAGSNPQEQELAISFHPPNRNNKLLVELKIDGVTYRSNSKKGKDVVRWKYFQATGVILAKVKIVGRPDLNGSIALLDSPIPHDENAVVVLRPTMGYQEQSYSLKLAKGYIEKVGLQPK